MAAERDHEVRLHAAAELAEIRVARTAELCLQNIDRLRIRIGDARDGDARHLQGRLQIERQVPVRRADECNAHQRSFAPKFPFGSNSSVARPSGSAAWPALRARNSPLPGLARSLLSETRTSPRSSTVVGQPFTVRPFHGV